MQIIFKTPKLEKQYESSQKAIRAYGAQVGRKFINRINILKSAKDLPVIMGISVLRCHPLSGNRDGFHSITLHGRWRLILKIDESTPGIVGVEEVSNHYDD